MSFDSMNAILTRPPVPLIPSETEAAMETIKKQVLRFQASLDTEHDVGLMLTNFGASTVMEIQNVSFTEPCIIVFKGLVNGCPSTLVQHVSQLNFLLTAIPKPVEKPKNQIGFTVN